jgi:hypothetical protein
MIIKDWEDRTNSVEEKDETLFKVSKENYPVRIDNYEIRTVNRTISTLDMNGQRKIVRFFSSVNGVKYIYILPFYLDDNEKLNKYLKELFVIIKLMG